VSHRCVSCISQKRFPDSALAWCTRRQGKGWRGGFLLSAAEQYLKIELTKNFRVSLRSWYICSIHILRRRNRSYGTSNSCLNSADKIGRLSFCAFNPSLALSAPHSTKKLSYCIQATLQWERNYMAKGSSKRLGSNIDGPGSERIGKDDRCRPQSHLAKGNCAKHSTPRDFLLICRIVVAHDR